MPLDTKNHIDYLIVGSGLAALVFGALAARSGARVTILEAHEHAGGYGRTFSMGKSARFNAQFHYVWNCGEGQTVNQVLQALELDQTVTFEQYDPDGFDRMVVPGYDMKIPGDSQALISRLTAATPSAHAQIAAFIKRVQQVARGLDLIASEKTFSRLAEDGLAGLVAARYAKATLQDVFSQFKLPQVTQALLASQWPDFLLPPEKLSFFAWVMLFTGYQRGAYYPTHHFESVIDALVDCIEAHGGAVNLNQQVTGFTQSQGRVTGVQARDTTTGQSYELPADHVVSNMDPKAAAALIGLDQFSGRERKKLNYEYSPSNFMIYCTVKDLDLEAYGFGRWNTFHSGDLDINRTFKAMYENNDYTNPSFALTTPGLLTDDATDRPAGQQIVELLTVANYAYFEDLLATDRGSYLRKKKEIVDNIFDVVEEKYLPGFRKHLAFKVSGSPTTNERFCWAPRGNSYGSNMTPDSISFGRVPTETSIPGLYFCNASSGYPGFAGAFWNGRDLFNRLL